MSPRVFEKKPDWLLEKEKLERERFQQPLQNGRHYWPKKNKKSKKQREPAEPFVYALACLQVVRTLGIAEREYQKAKEAWGLPGCITTINNIQRDLEKSSHLREIQNPDSLLQVGGEGVNNTDLQELHSCFAEFIKVAFYGKIYPDPESTLFAVVEFWTLSDFLGIKLEDFNKYPPRTIEGEIYDVEDIMRRKPTAGIGRTIYRSLTPILTEHCVLLNDKKILRDAKMWYECRIDPGSFLGYFDKLAEEDGVYSDRDHSHVSKDLKPYDDAMGYDRERW